MPPVTNYNIFTLSTESVVGISTAGTGSIQLSTSAANPVTLVASTALNTVAIGISTAATISSISASSTPAVAGSTYSAGRKGYLAYNQGSSPVLIAYSTAVSSANYSVQLNASDFWEMPVPLSALPMSIAVSTTLTLGTATVLITDLA